MGKGKINLDNTNMFLTVDFNLKKSIPQIHGLKTYERWSALLSKFSDFSPVNH